MNDSRILDLILFERLEINHEGECNAAILGGAGDSGLVVRTGRCRRRADTDLPEFLGRAELTSLASTFNLNLSLALGVLDATHPDIEILLYDVFTALNEIIADTAAYGLTVVDQSRIVNLEFGICNPLNWCQWLFRDGAHPTSRGHQIIAQLLAEQLG